MEHTVTIYLFGTPYTVPDNVTVMRAMEYLGYPLLHAHGCESGICGACAFVFRLAGQTERKTCLACQTKVLDGMCILSFPSLPLVNTACDIDKLIPAADTVRKLYPALDACIGCRACNRACPIGLDVMEYVADAKRGAYRLCAEKTVACVMCSLCAERCPAGITPPQVAMLARRLNGKFLSPGSAHLDARIGEMRDGTYTEELKVLTQKPISEMKALYNTRKIEP